MKREIKFRVWDKKEKKMYSRIWAINWYGYGELDKGIEVRETASAIKFEDADLLQYTGLKDKNGEEIYEGDIIKWFDEIGENPNLFKVEYDEAHWIIVPISETMDGWYLGNNVLEIVGNIYENPELLQWEEVNKR